MRRRSGHDKAKPQAGRQGRLRACYSIPSAIPLPACARGRVHWTAPARAGTARKKAQESEPEQRAQAAKKKREITLTIGVFFDGTGNNANNSGDRQAACSGEHYGMNDADAGSAYSQCVRLKRGYSGTAAGSYIGYYSNVHWLNTLYRQDIRPDTWYRQLDTSMQAEGITGLTEDIRHAVVSPEASQRVLPAPARMLHVLRDAGPLTAATYEKDTEAALADLLARAGFTSDQAHELQWHRISWSLMVQEEADRRELNSLLDELEQRQLYCNRGQLTEIVFSPVRRSDERWTERLHWLLMTDAFGFCSPLSRDAGARALAILAGYTGQEVADHLARVTVWNNHSAGTPS